MEYLKNKKPVNKKLACILTTLLIIYALPSINDTFQLINKHYRYPLVLEIIINEVAASSGEGQVTLAWDSNTESDISYYKLFWNDRSGSGWVPTQEIPHDEYCDSKECRYTITGRDETKVHDFKAKAYDIEGNASGFSNMVTGTPGKYDDSGGGGCFIATAVYGDYNAPEVKFLRNIKDDKLNNYFIGRKFIDFYYSGAGEKAAEYIQHKIPWAIPIIRTGLNIFIHNYKYITKKQSNI